MKYNHFSMLPTGAFQPYAPGRMRLHGGDAPDPDPQIGAAQRELSDLAIRKQDWYENNLAPKVLAQMDQSLTIAQQQADASKQMQEYQLGLSKKYDDRYWGTQVPLENELIAQARQYNTAAEQERMAGEAGGDVEQAAAAGGKSLQRGLAMRGINTGSAAAISALADMRSNADLAKAGAMNKTREAARQMGWTKLGEAAALGRGLPSFGSSSAQLSIGAGGNALQAGQAGLGAVGTAGNISNANTQTVGNLWNQSANIGLQKYQAQMQGYMADQQLLGGALGAVGSLAGMAMFA